MGNIKEGIIAAQQAKQLAKVIEILVQNQNEQIDLLKEIIQEVKNGTKTNTNHSK